VSASHYAKQSNTFAFSTDIQQTQYYLSTLGWLIAGTVPASLIFAQHIKIFGA